MSLGATYLDKFKIGDYVTWRTLSIDKDRHYNEFYGLIVDLIYYEDEIRPVHYARVRENKAGDTFYVVLSCLKKVETN